MMPVAYISKQGVEMHTFGKRVAVLSLEEARIVFSHMVDDLIVWCIKDGKAEAVDHLAAAERFFDE